MDRSHTPPPAFSEVDRLSALHKLEILDTPPERDFDEITRLAAAALGVASSAISLIDEERQWFKSRHGIPFSETPRNIAFCTHAVASRGLLVVPDATQDDRFSSNPLVTQESGIRFYAGIPLIVSSGHCLGTLCVFDPTARDGLTAPQEAVLRDLAKLATDLIESRRFRNMGEIAARVVDATSDAVLAADRHGTIVYWNPAAERMFGHARDEALGRNVEIIIPPRLAEGHRDIFARAAAGGATRIVGTFVELVGGRADGSEFPVELSLARWGAGPPEGGFAAIIRDISARKVLEREREQTQAFLDTVVTNLPAMLFVKDTQTRQYLMINRAGEVAIGRPARDIIGQTDKDLFPDYGEDYERRDNESIASPSATIFESEFVREDGESVHLRTTRTLIDGPDRPGQYLLGISEDVTATRLAEAEVLRLAHYDALTGLLNRASFTDKLHRLVRAGEPFAMLSIDLDRFKAVNDQFGHPVGDVVLSQVGDRLRSAVPAQGWVARIGGDEFIAILTGARLRERADDVASAVLMSICKPFLTDRVVAHVGASIGIVLMPEDGLTTEQLRENVDLALYRAKQMGRGKACFFNAEMDAAAQDRRKLETELREAIEKDRIELAYQPVLSANSGQITSAEALARWTHPERGPIRPDIFISLAEECGLIDRLGEQLLRRACRDAQDWPEHVRVAINLSPMQFISGRLVETVRRAMDDSGIRADRVQLEVTEGLVIRDVERTFKQLEELRALGIQILIDDFGVGYSSLSYFQRFTFDKVKIDKSFVDEIATSRAAKAIVQAVVGLGRALDMGIVAEGIETEEQVRLLIESGCTHLQGYLLSKPVGARTLRQMLTHSPDFETKAFRMA
ncbi:diguanylate cyclase (GGDEF)-like protein/PAS domain S-box-containing protein [Sphingobium sp. B2D3A]|uniref:sensor domain-containing phosphodiesterase n=1 Tax=unclassified Sphingobium TaxID=2611147 RepID=UPI0022249697|nr:MULTISPECIES: EAL domain-containing protein [unclassified Sphingobium]MCW2335980.1 diguanylate cyclase (GGDEF)-like protein/PAS domain S-box-containing protein [Sphingobium sp. B2D3A]MCW2385739.1 diguanylate cyclase (GGDEF)-like protein/PAS domain S-box-containing protein [Sphingobium sp. B2D3D]